jgi:mannose-6-phosphate isomerase-like protein (cupin superfamily)
MSSTLRCRTFKYDKPEPDPDRPLNLVKLGRTDRMLAYMQVRRTGGENRLHSHSHLDGFWMVMRGRARFYTEGDAVVADLGPNEGVVIPRGFKYWFESSGVEDLEILQVEAFDIAIPGEDLPRDSTRYSDELPAPHTEVDGRTDDVG